MRSGHRIQRTRGGRADSRLFFEDISRAFLSLVVAKLLSRETEPSQIFARHPAWRFGPWPACNGDPVPGVAIEGPRGELLAAFEIETASTLRHATTPQRWRKLGGRAPLDLVVPRRLLEQQQARVRRWNLPVKRFWSYAIDASGRVHLHRD